MSEDNQDFFAAPADDAPILLGEAPAPPQDAFGGSGDEMTDFASPPSDDAAYLGDLNEAPSAGDENAPIYLGPSGSDDYMAPPPQDFVAGSADEGDHMDGALVASGPSPMAQWNAEWQVLLQQRKDEENARKAELLAAAQEALKQMQLEREQKREAKMAKNREDEQAKLEAIEADLENDNSWQRVAKMVELSHDSSQKSADVKRMRDILIGLKNDTTKAVELSA